MLNTQPTYHKGRIELITVFEVLHSTGGDASFDGRTASNDNSRPSKLSQRCAMCIPTNCQTSSKSATPAFTLWYRTNCEIVTTLTCGDNFEITPAILQFCKKMIQLGKTCFSKVQNVILHFALRGSMTGNKYMFHRPLSLRAEMFFLTLEQRYSVVWRSVYQSQNFWPSWRLR